MGQATGAFCDLLISLIPKSAGQEAAYAVWQMAYEALKAGQFKWRTILTAVRNGNLEWLALEGRQLMSMTAALFKFAAALLEALNAGRERDELRQEVERQLRAIDAAINRYREAHANFRPTESVYTAEINMMMAAYVRAAGYGSP